jgi:copper resistance protein C
MASPLYLRILIAVLFLGLSPLIAVRTADAHAVIIDSIPAVDAVVAAGDTDVTLHFNSRIDHQRSRLTLVAADGKTTALTMAPDSAADIVAAKITGLGAGQYRLRWQVLAIDGHLTRGDIRFSVKAP